MKVSNETKIGILAVVSVSLFFMGFNFIKGRNLIKRGTFIYAKYTETKGLLPSNAVFANGLQVGSVYEIEANEQNLNDIIVAIKLNGKFNIPNNSLAIIKTSVLGGATMEIKLGNSATFIKDDDTLQTANYEGVMGELTNKIEPIADKLTLTLGSLDTVLKNVNTVLDPNTKGNLQSVVANLAKATASLVVTANEIQKMVNSQNGVLSSSLKNVESFSKNLADNNTKISATLTNVEEATNKIAKANIDGVVNKLDASVAQLQTAMSKLNSKEGTAGKLLNDDEVYKNLASTILSLNILMDDLRVHPKRYVNISVFGKKDKGDFLTTPLPVDTLKKNGK